MIFAGFTDHFLNDCKTGKFFEIILEKLYIKDV